MSNISKYFEVNYLGLIFLCKYDEDFIGGILTRHATNTQPCEYSDITSKRNIEISAVVNEAGEFLEVEKVAKETVKVVSNFIKDLSEEPKNEYYLT